MNELQTVEYCMSNLNLKLNSPSEIIEWSANDAISISIIVFALAGHDMSLLESYLPDDRDDYFLSMSNRIHLAQKLTPAMAIDLLHDVNAHEEADAFNDVLLAIA